MEVLLIFLRKLFLRDKGCFILFAINLTSTQNVDEKINNQLEEAFNHWRKTFPCEK